MNVLHRLDGRQISSCPFTISTNLSPTPKPDGGNGGGSVINAAPDGYTLVVGGLSNIVFNASLYEKKPYDPLTQLVPIAIIYRLSYVLAASNNRPFKSVHDVVSAAKAKPGTLNLATAGVGTGQQLTAVAFMNATNTQMLEVLQGRLGGIFRPD
jgi:tripartite-type tricarboxylate transporter receptor subunit TctC